MLKEKDRTDLTSTAEGFSHPAGTNVNPSTGGYKNHSKISGLFQQLKSHFFNEMVDDQTMSGETCSKIEHWLSQHTIDELKLLNQAAKDHFLYEGITFTVYGESEGIERTIPYDLIPRVIEKKQWNKVALGCSQRVRALNLFLHDIYHQQDILKANIVPELQVLTHEAYQPHMYAHDLKGKIYSQISGIDIIRDRHGEFYVLEDNLRTPSGVSYMLESRKISQKLMPDLCQQNNILGIEQYPQLLKEVLAENAYVDKPFIVVLTPGRYNSAYYEHSFLAREMDVPLVTSRDLFVENDKVYVKTICGRQQVDVIYRRVDDAYLDPLCFMPDSTLGVAGLMSAYLRHNVVIANAPGTGVADDKSIYPYVDKMIHFYLGEQAILKNVPTYQCREAQDLDYVLSNLEQLVVKEAQGSGGYGMLIGPQASKSQIESFRDKIIATPNLYIAQPTLDLSVCPTLNDFGVAERHIDLRPFVLSSPYRTEIVPGGLTRVAMQAGSLVVNSSQGGGVKDTWVVDNLHS
ncbi:circularly permuted type 2 ATP-grasp protein [Acinetobacter terrae]|uniref:Circularly permuted type 2 ATP-grasp protein n=1 Tax=Acinetobacter terrae TaxID=2731247 RepID=A0A8E4FAV9_9GAMM|nr:circularly permuted type 2 ATP-grasp protein [Acinetobacter terrae]NNH16029.1 circularly permuted type 2 ATP-grasp protein [Acinetobacter terrae]NNH37229.1 circularly permuted type 2 ATP-grasp protein [Acinetobacter terrae]